MSRLLKPLSAWDEADVQALVDEGIDEGQRLEYKRELKLGTRAEKVEAAKDASGMANAAGGLIIYGVQEKELQDGRRVPTGLTPLADGAAAAHLEDVLYGTVSPRLNFTTAMPSASAGGFYLIVRVQQRVGALHMVEAHGQHKYFLRSGLATRPMAAHEVEAAFRGLGSTSLRIRAELGELPLIPRLSGRQRISLLDDAEPGSLPWESVVMAPLDPGADLEMRTPDPHDFPIMALKERYLSHPSYLSSGCFDIDASGYVDEDQKAFEPRLAGRNSGLIRLLRLYRNGWCEWGFRYGMVSDAVEPNLIPALRLITNVHDAMLYLAQTYADRGYFGRLRLWVRIDNADLSHLRIHQRFINQPRTPRDEAISFQIDTNVERLLAEPLAVTHAAMDRIWQGYGLSRCEYFADDGQLIESYFH